jgi:hypothetical protein
VATKAQRLLLAVGKGGLFETLFTDGNAARDCEQYMEILDYMIAYKWNQSDVERCGSTMNLTKTKHRSSIGDDIFPALVWLAFNCPPIYQIDFTPILVDWYTNHRAAIGGYCIQESRVISRLKAAEKHSMLH